MSSEWAGVDGGGSVAPSMSGGGQQAAEVVPRWWNPLDSVAIDASNVWAYRAQASVGSPWGLAPANYLETLRNWVNPGVNDLTEGAGPIPWIAATGWNVLAAAAQWFDTGITPANDQSYVMFVQYTGAIVNNAFVAGMLSGSGRVFGLQPIRNNVSVSYRNGGSVFVNPFLAAGNISVVGNQGYRNSVADGGPIAVWGGASLHDIFIAAINNVGVPVSFFTGSIQAVLISDDATAFLAVDRAAIAANPGGSMFNL